MFRLLIYGTRPFGDYILKVPHKFSCGYKSVGNLNYIATSLLEFAELSSSVHVAFSIFVAANDMRAGWHVLWAFAFWCSFAELR